MNRTKSTSSSNSTKSTKGADVPANESMSAFFANVSLSPKKEDIRHGSHHWDKLRATTLSSSPSTSSVFPRNTKNSEVSTSSASVRNTKKMIAEQDVEKAEFPEFRSTHSTSEAGKWAMIRERILEADRVERTESLSTVAEGKTVATVAASSTIPTGNDVDGESDWDEVRKMLKKVKAQTGKLRKMKEPKILKIESV